jgi:hypothetical protein
MKRLKKGFSFKILKREIIMADSKKEYEEKKKELLSKVSKGIKVSESKLYVGIMIFIETKSIS